MADFTAITTQEQLNAALGERLSREAEKHKKELEQLQTQYTGQISTLTKEKENLQNKCSGYDDEIKGYKSRIVELERESLRRNAAYAAGIPMEFSDRLRGTTKEEIEEDAKNFSQLVGKPVAPLASTDPSDIGDPTQNAMNEWLKTLK